MGVGPGKVYRWYKDHLSDFQTKEQQNRQHQHDIIRSKIDRQTGLPEIVRVPIMKSENMGADMCIDEKYIGGEYYTLLANRATGKIALMAGTQKTDELCSLFQQLDIEKRFSVKHFTRDLLPAYDWTGRQMFMNAQHVADKFHILQHLFDALQSIRITYRSIYLTARRQAYDIFTTTEKKRKKECIEKGESFAPGIFQSKEEKLENGESHRELLARSVYLLYKFPNQWKPSQQDRAKVLFKHYPDLHTAYQLACSFRQWYSKENIGQAIETVTARLKIWFEKVASSAVEDMLNFKSMVERHMPIILNYFESGKTNANAESLNAKIQRFIQANNGARDLDFTFFRISLFFS